MSNSPQNHEAIAIAYLTGQATDDQVKEHLSLYATNTSYIAKVRELEIWLAPLNENVEDITPPTGLLEDIMLEIQEGEVASETVETDPPSPANDNVAGKWMAMAIAASVVAILAIGSHFVPLTEIEMRTENETFMALLSDSTQPELVAIVYNPKTGKVVARLSNITVPEDGDLQLWLIREGEDAPVSLGVLEKADQSGQVEFEIPKTLQGGTDTLALSLEQVGGSPSAGPEGPILYTGTVAGLSADI